MSSQESHIAERPEAALAAALERYRVLGWPSPHAVLVSGSGLSVDIGTPLREPMHLGEFLGLPVQGIEGHPLRVELVEALSGHPVLYFRGRLHGYQGHPTSVTVLPARLAGAFGARAFLQTNASGGVCPDSQRPGDLMLVTDQINLTGMTPLRGELPASWGPRFPIMLDAFDPRLLALARAKASELDIRVLEGVYAGLTGPAYETAAEARMLRTLGAHATGMSTVLEVIAARQMGVRCFALSLITNISATAESDHAEVLAIGRAAAERVQRLLGAMLGDASLYSS